MLTFYCSSFDDKIKLTLFYFALFELFSSSKKAVCHDDEAVFKTFIFLFKKKRACQEYKFAGAVQFLYVGYELKKY